MNRYRQYGKCDWFRTADGGVGVVCDIDEANLNAVLWNLDRVEAKRQDALKKGREKRNQKEGGGE